MLWAILLCQLVIPIFAAHKDKFKSCSSSGFCQRQKELDSITYYLDHNSVSFNNNEFNSILLYASNPTDNSKKLHLSVSRVINNVLRIFVTELNPIRERYQIDDVMTENARKFLPFQNVQQSSNDCTLTWNDNYSLKISYNPFTMLITNNGVHEIVINEFNKFYFEPYIERKVYDSTDCDDSDDDESKHCQHESAEEKALWEERFSSHTYYYDNGPASIGLDFTFIDTKYIYGIPEHASKFALKNTLGGDENSYSEPYRLWNLDVFEYELDVPDALYGAIPYIIGHNKQNTNSVLWMNAAETYIDVGNSAEYNGKNVRWMSESGVLEAFVILSAAGDAGTYLHSYYALTGFPQLPPIFALGHHQCRWNYNDMADVQDISDQFDALNIPNDFIWLDIEHTDGKRYFTWDKHNFAAPDVMLEYVASGGRKMVTIVDPHIKEDANYYIHSEMDKLDVWTKNRDSSIYSGWCWPGTSRYPDFSNPAMRDFWAQQFRYENYKYSSAALFTWNDMNEPSVFDGPEVSMPVSNLHFNNRRHNEIHNLYGYYVHSATFDGLLQRDDSKYRPFVLSRSFFSGSQRFGAVWTGDNTANWQHLQVSVAMLLSLSVSGLPFVGADIGGFFNNPDGELMARWYELGAYYPFFRNHAHQDTDRRELWQFDDEYQLRMKHSILARYRILPYIYTLFYLSFTKYSAPVMQPLWYVFGDDESTFDREDAFMFGPAFYIQPIVESGISEIDVNLPQNAERNAIFYEISENKVNIYAGGGSYHLHGYSSRIPVLRYGGTVTVEKHRIRRSSATMTYDPVTLVFTLDVNGNADGFHYMDDEHTLNHIDRKEYIFTKIQFVADGNKIINTIIHGNESQNIPQIEIERIVIMGENIDHKGFTQIHIKQLTNSRKTRQFGVGHNTLVIRKPQIFINLPFQIILS